MRGRVLVESGSTAEAKASLAAALEASPDNVDALSAFVDVCIAEEDWAEAEKSLIRLGRLLPDADAQRALYLRLGGLYEDHLENLERAERAFLEVLKLAPDDAEARERLAALYLKSGEIDKAFEQQDALVAAAETPAEKCTRMVRLAEIFEASGDVKQAEQTLVKVRRTWPKEPEPVRALYEFYVRNEKVSVADTLLERAAADVRRGLGAGRFERPLFGLAAMVARMRGQHDAANMARATLAAIEGVRESVGGADLAAGSQQLDERLAPDVFNLAFRSLLGATASLLDDAVPYDLNALRAKPLPPEAASVLARTREIAGAYGLSQINAFVTSTLGAVCVPGRVEPPTLVFGLPLVKSERSDVREFLIHRAVKALQSRTAALARTAPIDLWPLVAAYLKTHNPSYEPVGADPAKLNQFFERLKAVAPTPLDAQLIRWAGEVADTIGNRGASLNTAANAWGSRAALLATGDPYLGVEAIAWAMGKADDLPQSGAERVRWVGRQAEARDLIVFSVSEEHAELRRGLDMADEATVSERPTEPE